MDILNQCCSELYYDKFQYDNLFNSLAKNVGVRIDLKPFEKYLLYFIFAL